MAKIIFAQEHYYPFQSVAKLSAYLKSVGHQVCMAIGSVEKIVSEIKQQKPDLIGFSILTPQRNFLIDVASAVKEAGIKAPVIAGGYDITFTPTVIEFSDLDIICRGEGEAPLEELCNRIDAGEDYTDIPNLWIKRDGEIIKNEMRTWAVDLDKRPFDDQDIYLDYDPFFKIVPFSQVIAGRGCPYKCSYCFSDSYRQLYQAEGSTKFCNLRSPENVIDELRILKDKYKAKYIFFNDSTLTYNVKWLREFLPKYGDEIGLPFAINAVAGEVTEEVGQLLRDTGCCELVKMGLETGNEKFRIEVLDKKVTDAQLETAVSILQKFNIRYSLLMMIGLPGETIDMSWETLETAGRLSTKGSTQSVGLFSPFPGLPITEYGIKIGQYRREDLDPYETTKPLPSNPRRATAKRKSLLEKIQLDPVSIVRKDIAPVVKSNRKALESNIQNSESNIITHYCPVNNRINPIG
jgi:radical SAM superfamily enzyme YgiQ (UPF0313 family)